MTSMMPQLDTGPMTSQMMARYLPRVMFVDDEEQFLDSLAQWQPDIAVKRRTTSDIDECLNAVRAGEVDLLISDRVMPGQDGITLLETARASDPHMRLVLLTAYPPTDVQRARLADIGADIVIKNDGMTTRLRKLLAESMATAAEVTMLRQRVRSLEELNRAWAAELIAGLELIPNPAEAAILSSEGRITIAQLIEEIRTSSPRGIRYAQLWLQSRKSVRENRKRKKWFRIF